MFSTLALALASMAAALPAPAPQVAAVPEVDPKAPPAQSVRFTGLAIRPGADFNGWPIHATDKGFYIGRPTTTYTPDLPEIDPAAYNQVDTIFSFNYAYTLLDLSTAVPGGQRAFVKLQNDTLNQAAGYLGFTGAHRGADSVLYDGFETTLEGDLLFEGRDWLACPFGEQSWTIWAQSRLIDATTDCLFFRWSAVEVDDTVKSAWQYE